jgi:hypothetical protein
MKIEEFKGTVYVPRSFPGGEAEDEYDEKKGFPLVRFDSYRHPFLMTEMSCTNPECNCNEIGLSFTEIDQSGIPILDRITFSFYLDLKTWQENRYPGRSKVSQRFVDEFINNLTDEMKTRFKKNYAIHKESARKASTFTMPVEEIKNGTLVSYTDVFGSTDSVSSGGRGIGYSFENKGKEYFIDDLYCINPRCKCESVHLVFLTYDEKIECITDLFVGSLSFKKGIEIDEENTFCTRKEAIKIFKDWKKSDPKGMDLLKNRYKEMKDIGQRILTEDKAGGVKNKIYSKKRKKKRKR